MGSLPTKDDTAPTWSSFSEPKPDFANVLFFDAAPAVVPPIGAGAMDLAAAAPTVGLNKRAVHKPLRSFRQIQIAAKQ